MTHAAPTRIAGTHLQLRRAGLGREIARTAAFNIAQTAAAGLGGVVIARALGATVQGEYAAITAWFGIAVLAGQLGQPAAVCFFVAKDPENARAYIATSRSMTFATGAAALVLGELLAPLLGRGRAEVVFGYRMIFAASVVSFVAAGYIYALQGRDIRRWNVTRLVQPTLGFLGIIVAWRIGALDLRTALLVVVATLSVQLLWAYIVCRRAGLAPGRAELRLVRPLFSYGAAQIAALTPATVNAQLDQLILSQAVPAADLGRYAIAVTLSLLPLPLVSAIGYVAFPRLAAGGLRGEVGRKAQMRALAGAAGLAAGLMVPIAGAAPWLVPLVFGSEYGQAVPLLWVLAPGTIFLASGQVLGDLLRGNNRPGSVAKAQSIAALFTVALLLALLPVVGVYGAAVATSVAYGVALAAMLVSIRRMWRQQAVQPETSRCPHGRRKVDLRTDYVFVGSKYRHPRVTGSHRMDRNIKI